MKSRVLRLAVGLSIAGLFAFLSLREVKLSEISQTFSNLSLGWLLVILVLTVVVLFLRSWRWGILLSPVKKLSVFTLFTSLVIGYMANNLLPLRAGEIIRVYHLGARTGLPKSTILGSILVERILDIWTVLILLLVGARFMTFSPEVRHLLRLGIILSGGLLVALYLFCLRQEQLIRATKWALDRVVPRFAERGERILRAFADGASLISEARRFFILIGMSLSIWLAGAVIAYCVSLALSLSLPAWGAPVVLSIVALGITIPTAPGDIGTFQFFSLLGLSMFGIVGGAALTFSIVLHGSQFIPITLIGLGLVLRESITFAGLRRIAWKAEKQTR